RVNEVREVVVVAVNNVPVRVKDLVAGAAGPSGADGVSVSHLPRLGKVSVCRPKVDADGREGLDARGERVWEDEEDKVQGIVLMRKNEPTLPSLKKVHEKVQELNETTGALLPGTELQLSFDLTGLIHATTETVQENLLVGMALVAMVLLMFLSNV